jgi:hypothetical protein
LLTPIGYAQQMKHRAYQSAPLSYEITEAQVGKGIRDMVVVQEYPSTKGKNYSFERGYGRGSCR